MHKNLSLPIRVQKYGTGGVGDSTGVLHSPTKEKRIRDDTSINDEIQKLINKDIKCGAFSNDKSQHLNPGSLHPQKSKTKKDLSSSTNSPLRGPNGNEKLPSLTESECYF
jgi:hypothetical protein